MSRNSCCAGAEQAGKGTCTSKARVTEHRANTPTAKKANKEISGLSCEPSPTRGSLGIRMPVSLPCYAKFQQRGRRSRPIRLQLYIQSLASLNFQVTAAPRSRIFLG